MALSEDQKAMLRLLAQRGEQGYEDLAALMGIGVDEVHAKATEAAAQLEAEGIPAPTIPSPPGSPAVPASKPKSEPASPEPKRTPPPRPNLPLPTGSGARAAIAAGVLVLVALVLVLVLGGGEDSSDTTSGSDGTTASEQGVDAATGKDVTQAILEAVDGSEATGVATFGRVKNALALQVEASGLEPTDRGESYTIWLYQSPRKMLPLASTRVGEEGRIAAQVEVPTEVLGYLANETFGQIDISRTADATLKASLAKATRERKAPIYTGTDVLRGQITGPIIGAAR